MKPLIDYINEAIKKLPRNIKGIIVFDIDDTLLQADDKIIKAANILAGETPFISIKDSPDNKSDAETITQVKSVTGRALNFKRLILQFTALKKKKLPPIASMASPRVSAYSPAPAPFLISITNPVESTERKEISIGKRASFLPLNIFSANVPKAEIKTALKYLIPFSGEQKIMYPSPAPTAENKKFFLLETVIREIAKGQHPPITDEKLMAKDTANHNIRCIHTFI